MAGRAGRPAQRPRPGRLRAARPGAGWRPGGEEVLLGSRWKPAGRPPLCQSCGGPLTVDPALAWQLVGRRRPAGRWEFCCGRRSSITKWRCQAGRLGRRGRYRSRVILLGVMAIGMMFNDTRPDARSRETSWERRAQAGPRGPELGQGGPEWEGRPGQWCGEGGRGGLRGGPRAPPSQASVSVQQGERRGLPAAERSPEGSGCQRVHVHTCV